MEVVHKGSFWKILCNGRWYGAGGVSRPFAGLESKGFLADALEELICIKSQFCA